MDALSLQQQQTSRQMFFGGLDNLGQDLPNFRVTTPEESANLMMVSLSNHKPEILIHNIEASSCL